MLGRHKSPISRECWRNRSRRGYRPRHAHRLALARRHEPAHPRLHAESWQQVEALLRQAWSPEQVAGRLKREQGIRISHEWIDQHIYAAKRLGGNLHRSLRCQKARRKRYGPYDRRGRIPTQVSIDERPAVVEAKRRIGDGEGDAVIGKGQQGALVTLVERKSLYTVIQAAGQKTAAVVRHPSPRG